MTSDPQAAELGAFLKARRAEIEPGDVGLHATGRRRVDGLRREEVAQLAAISTDYYTRIEQGRRPPSEQVLDAIARILLLDADQRAYVFELARASSAKTDPATRRRAPRPQVPQTVQALIDAWVTAPAVVHDGRLDVVAANALGRALYADALDGAARPNLARFLFLDPRSQDFFVDWDATADDAASMLRQAAAHAPHNRDLTDLIGELVVRSDRFKARWAAHQIRGHRRGVKRFRHPIAGPLDLRYEALEIADAGLTLYGYVADPGTPSAERLQLLASWTAPQHPPHAPQAEDLTNRRDMT
jgi:transcriptional regulator with XRE-family HTH domain